jgi:flagellar biosynthesis/type III secretory pathway protein FliH
LSNLLRAEAVAVVNSHGPAAPRVFGGRRLLHNTEVGLQTPKPLPVPISRQAAGAFLDQDMLQAEVTPPPPMPDFAAIEEAARLQGFNHGYEQGYAEGMAAAEQSMRGMLEQLGALIANVHENHSTFFRAAERQVVDLALQIAQKVVEREVENMPDLAVNVIRSALDEMDARTAVRVRVSPSDDELLRRRWPTVVPPGLSPDSIELVADERVQSGGAIIETNQGLVDAQLETKLAQLGNALWTFVMDVNSQSTDGDSLGA